MSILALMSLVGYNRTSGWVSHHHVAYFPKCADDFAAACSGKG